MDVKEFLDKKVAIEFKSGGEILGIVLSVLEGEIELKLLDSDEVSEIKISDIEYMEELLATKVKKSGNIKKRVSSQGSFVDKDDKKRKKKPPRSVCWS